MNHFHSLLMRAYDYCWVGGGRKHPIYYLTISYNFGCKWVKYSIFGVNLVQIHLFWFTFTLRTQTTQIKCLEHLFKYDRF